MRKKFIYILLSASLLNFGCDALSDFGDMNVNPGATVTPIPAALLTNVLAGIGNYAANNHLQPALYSQYVSETQYTEASIYSLAQNSFTSFYSGSLMDLQNIINTDVNNANMKAVAQILQQYIFWYLTDCWGDLPYSEALNGVLPKYDTQEEIYKGLITKLTEAENSFVSDVVISGDIIYNGNVVSWKKFANSLRMLISLQLSKRYSGAADYAATEFKAALNDSDGHISDNIDNFTVRYPGGIFKNPWRSVYDGRRDYAQSKTMTDITANLGDPRQSTFGGVTEDLTAGNALQTSNVGFPYGLSRANAEAFSSANVNFARVLRGDFRKEDSPYVVIGAAHILLARSEAAQLGWTNENKTTLYRQGIELSFAQWEVTPPASYFTQSSVVLNGTNDANKITLQRYLAHYPDGRMGWNIWRKSNYPELIPAPGAAPGTAIPRRFVYSPTEYSSNKEGVEAAVARMGGNDLMSNRVWWDVQ